MRYIIEDEFENHCFTQKSFDCYEDGWDFLYQTFPVICHEDGSQDDRDEELGSYYVVKKTEDEDELYSKFLNLNGI